MRKIIWTLLLVLSVCVLAVQALAAQTEESVIELKYDDRKDLGQLLNTTVETVEITDQSLISYQTGTTEKDTAVLVYDDGTLYAVGTGTATLNVNGTAYTVKVVPAELSLFMYTGHSIGAGASGNAKQSVVVEAGQAYSSYDPKSLDLTQVEGYGLGWGAAKRVGNVDVSVYGSGSGHIDAFGAGNKGTRGSGSALAYQWNQLTGQKVWVINVAVGGSCLNEWMPDAEGHSTTYSDYYNTAVAVYSYAQTVLTNEIAAGHYTLGHMGILYYCGANQNYYPNWTYELIEENYDTLWNGFKTAFARDMDGDGDTETVEFLGLVPAWTNSSRDVLSFDKTAAFYMGGGADFPDIFVASSEYRKYLFEDNLSAFPEITYTAQSVTPQVPTVVSYSETESSVLASDGVHPLQVVYNAIGMDTADNIYAWLSDADDTLTTFELVNINFGEIPDSVTLQVGESYLMAPVFEPVYADNLTYELTGNAKLSYPLQVVGTKIGSATLTIKQGDQVLDTVEFTVVKEHKAHCVCGGAAVGVGDHTSCSTVQEWTPISGTVNFGALDSGYYYLTDDVKLTTSPSIIGTMSKNSDGSYKLTKAKDIVLCLNGYTLSTTQTRVFSGVGQDSSLTVCDCSYDAKDGSFDGWIVGGTNANGSVIYTYAKSTMNIYGGNWTVKEGFSGTHGGIIAMSTERGSVASSNAAASQESVVNIYNGHITGGKAKFGGNIKAMHYSRLNIYGGSVTKGTTVQNDANTAGTGGNITVDKGATLYIAGTKEKPVVISGGNAAANGGNLYLTGTKVTIQNACIFDGTAPNNSNIRFNGELDMTDNQVYGGSADLVRVLREGRYWVGDYNNLTDALSKLKDETYSLQLLQDVAATDTVSGTLYIDLAGHTLSGITVTGTVYGADSATDDYTDTKAGKLSCTLDGGTVELLYKQSNPVRRYMTVETSEGYQFHRFYLGITKLNLKPSCAGVGYKAVFAGSDTVKAQLDGYGYDLWVTEDKTVTRTMSADAFVSLKEVTLRLNNVLSIENSYEVNCYNAEVPVNARVFMKLKNGQSVYTDALSYSFRDVTEAAVKGYDSMNTAQQNAVAQMINTYSDVMDGWDIEFSHHVTDSIPAWDGKSTNGTYYLDKDMTSVGITVPVGNTMKLCLNGHKITGSSVRAFLVEGSLEICDCKGNGYITGAARNGACIYVRGGTFTLSGGTLKDGYAYTASTTQTACGGNIYLKSGEVILSGGTVSGGKATTSGGNIYVEAGTLTINGGSVIGGSSPSGGSIYTAGTVQMYSGLIEGGATTGNGGNINLQSGTMAMTGGTVSGGVADGEGGNFRIGPSATLTLSGSARVEKGSAKNGGNIQLFGTLIMQDNAVLADGAATSAGGNISAYANSATSVANLNMTGGSILGGSARNSGSIRLQSNEGTVNASFLGGYVEQGVVTNKYPCIMLGNNHVNLTVGGNVRIDGIFILGGYKLQVSTQVPLSCPEGAIAIDMELDGIIAEGVTYDAAKHFRSLATDRKIVYDASAGTLALSTVLEEKMQAYLKNLSGEVTPTGVTKADYIAVMAQCLAEYNRINPLDTITVAGLDSTLQSYARVVGTMGAIVDYGAKHDISGFAEAYNCELYADYAAFKALYAQMMQTACEATITYAGKDVNNFAVRDIMVAYYLTQDDFDEATVAAWAEPLKQLTPTTDYYSHAEQTTNRNVYVMGAEQLRSYVGLANSEGVEAFLDASAARQVSHFDNNGMYRDNYGATFEHNPVLYDVGTRMSAQLALAFGYDGAYADELDEILQKGGLVTLFTTSAGGELAYGGRSNQYLFNAAAVAINCEFEANRYAALGDVNTAGAYKRTAHLAIQSISQYLAANKHVMNYYADDTVGTDDYGYYDKYMVSLSSFLAMAYIYADDTIQETAAPIDVGGYVVQTGNYFDSVVASVGNYSIQLLTSADDHYDSTGLGRIHKKGVYSALGLSTPFSADAVHTVPAGTQLTDMSLSPVWYINGERYALAEMNNLCHKLTVIEESADRVEFTITWWGSELVGMEALEEHYVLTDEGLTVTATMIGSSTDTILYTVPLLDNNGDSENAKTTQITTNENGFAVSLDGEVYTVTSDGTASCGTIKYSNRNGEYYMGLLEKEGDSITVTFKLD